MHLEANVEEGVDILEDVMKRDVRKVPGVDMYIVDSHANHFREQMRRGRDSGTHEERYSEGAWITSPYTNRRCSFWRM